MAILTNFYDTAMTLLLVSLLTYKAMLVFSTQNPGSIGTYVWFPSFFIADYVFFIVVSTSSFFVMARPSNKYFNGKFGIIMTILAGIFAFISIVGTFIIVSMDVSAYLAYGEQVAWELSVSVAKEWGQFEGLMYSNLKTALYVIFFQILVTIIASFVLIKWFRKSAIVYRRISESPRDKLATDTTRHAWSLMQPMNFVPSKRTAGLLGIYVILALIFRPTIPFSLASPTPIFHAIQKSIQGQYDSQKGSANLQKTNGANPAILSNAKFDEGSLKRNGGMKNVVLIFLESARADLVPFEADTAWAKKWVKPNAADITPYFRQLMAEGMFMKGATSASGYTLKSMTSTLCSELPMPKHNAKETFSRLFRHCLPTILRNSGYSANFYQPQVMNFDHQNELMKKLGFKRSFGLESYKSWSNMTKQQLKKHEANYFGMEDNIMLAPMLEWVDEQREHNKPFLLTYLTGITHDPYNMPPAPWAPRHLSRDKKINGYLNSVAYVDDMLRNITSAFSKRGNLMNETLFVMLGDHGIAFHEHGKMGTYNLQMEEAFRVPILFYTENEHWKPILKNNPHKEGNWSSMDVMPTILDILSGGGNLEQPKTDDGTKSKSQTGLTIREEIWPHGGKSMFQASGPRVRLSFANPGGHGVIREGHFVLIRPIGAFPSLYDLSKDPKQQSPITLLKKVEENVSRVRAHRHEEVWRWGFVALAFLKDVSDELLQAYATGEACDHCSISFLKNAKSLFDWQHADSLLKKL